MVRNKHSFIGDHYMTNTLTTNYKYN